MLNACKDGRAGTYQQTRVLFGSCDFLRGALLPVAIVYSVVGKLLNVALGIVDLSVSGTSSLSHWALNMGKNLQWNRSRWYCYLLFP